MSEHVIVQLIDNQSKTYQCNVKLENTSAGFEFVVEDPNLGNRQYSGYDLYEAFQNWRKDYSNQGIRILCNGCRRDFHVSGMSRDMGGGRLGYILKIGVRSSMEDLVDILKEASEAQVGTREEQEKHFQEWSLRLPRKR